MFPVFSIISHSCLPNANPVLLQKNQLALEAKLDIAKGEEITISYISIMQASHTWNSGGARTPPGTLNVPKAPP